MTAACSCGLCSTELVWSVTYQRQEKPCQALWDLPLLKENSTAITIGTSDQTRYSQVKPSRIHGWPQGLRRSSRRRRDGVSRAVAAAGAGAGVEVDVDVTRPPSTSGWWRPRSRSSAPAGPGAGAATAPRPGPPGR